MNPAFTPSVPSIVSPSATAQALSALSFYARVGSILPGSFDAYMPMATNAVREAMIDLTGHAPHVVISHLDRVKLDPNREIDEAAQDNPFAERAWNEYHGYIDRARAAASATD